MNGPFRTPEDYELFLYTLTEQFPAVQRSTVVFIRHGASLARVAGELYFALGFQLVVRERLLYHRLPLILDWYGYEAWRGEEKLYWYDSQPHPDDPFLQSTHPHHKHIPPDIKHHRVPAPALSFTQPNLSTLIREIEGLIHQIDASQADQAKI
jgi:Family of unknown function (DUF6516)